MAQAVAGTALVAGGAAVLNQVYERDTDALMRRTRLRPLPDGRVSPADARVFGVGLAAAGLALLAARPTLLAALLALATLVVYLVVYTPMKRRIAGCHAGRRGSRRASAADRVDGGARPAVGSAARRSSRSCSSGRFRISWRSPGCIATTTARRASRCSRSSNLTDAGPAGRLCLRGGAACR